MCVCVCVCVCVEGGIVSEWLLNGFMLSGLLSGGHTKLISEYFEETKPGLSSYANNPKEVRSRERGTFTGSQTQ